MLDRRNFTIREMVNIQSYCFFCLFHLPVGHPLPVSQIIQKIGQEPFAVRNRVSI